jgi:DNA-binding transcriptional LysR family regulator
MELRHLRYFVAVAEELHFRRAAERLHISQPPLSAQIRGLEEELGVELLVRNRRRVELTAAGRALLSAARAILDSVDEAVDLTRRVGRGEVGELSLAFVGSAMYGRLPGFLRAFREAHPGVELVLRELPTSDQLEQLRSGHIDVGVIRPPVHAQDLLVEEVAHERIVVALPEGHRLAARATLRPTDLAGERFVMLGRRQSPGLHESLAAVMAEVRDVGSAGEIQEVDQIHSVIGLVAAGFGISLVGESVAHGERQGIAYRPLRGPAPMVSLALAWRPGETSPTVAAFLDFVRRFASERELIDPENSNAPAGVKPESGGAD